MFHHQTITDMKTRHILLLALSLAATAAQAQMNIKISTGQTFRKDTIDHKVLTVQYGLDALTDLSKPDARMQETLRLDIGRQASRFYSYTAFVADSVLAADMANGASSELIAQHANQYQSQWSEQTFKNYPAGKVTTLDELAGDICRLRCEEPAEKPRWTLTQDTLTLLGYRCTRATTQFKGRQWSAWYTTDIPVSEGPWKLCGLPGLILKAEDDEGHYRFTADGLEQSRGTEPILFGGKDYQSVDRKQYDKMQKRFAADPVGFITGIMPNVKITVQDNHGNKTKNPKDTPYNPIER